MLRLIDANLNRISEGLRLLEDVARFILNDTPISAELKSLRHELSGDWSLKKALLSARDAAGDVGSFAEVTGEGRRADLATIVVANARRVQESLRVLEEFAKLPDQPIDSLRFKQARFSLYELEKKLVARLLRRDKRMTGLYVIIDPEALGEKEGVDVARQAIRGGANAIQLRDKQRGKREIMARAKELRGICAKSEVLFIIDDYLDIAITSGADGLHLGQSDLPISVARNLLPIDKILGCSTATLSEALQAQADGADYIAVGSIYPTPSKEGTRVIGLETLRQIREAVSLPIVAIGGINEDNAPAVIEAGAECLAVISAVVGAGDIAGAARRLTARFEVN